MDKTVICALKQHGLRNGLHLVGNSNTKRTHCCANFVPCVCLRVRLCFLVMEFSAQDTTSSVVGIGVFYAYDFTRLRTGRSGVPILKGQEVFFSPQYADKSWSPLTLVFNGYWEYFP